MRKRQLLNRLFLIITLLVTLSCNSIGSLWRGAATPTGVSPGATGSPSPVSYPPLPSPKLLSRTPEPHAAQPLDGPVELVFDQPMDQQSVGRAFAIEPRVAGDLTWADARTLRFTPRESYQRATTYEVTVGANARNVEGSRLSEPVTFDFQTIGFLEVAEVQPAPESADVDPDMTVTVIFNRPVVPLTSVAQQADLPQPLSFSPPVAGEGEWLNTAVYRFRPAEGFSPATAYTARVAAGLQDTQGAPLQADYTWSFTTVAPQAVAWFPEDNAAHVGPSSVISITFNQPMDHVSVEAAFELRLNDRPVAGRFSWYGGAGPLDEESLVFTPARALPRNATGYVAVADAARARDSQMTLAEPLDWYFRTALDPGIISTQPVNGEEEVDPYDDVILDFASPMQTDVFTQYLTILPAPTEVYTYWFEADTELRLSFPKKPATSYTLLLREDVPDKFGAPLGQSLRLRFTTGDLSPFAELDTLGEIGSFDAYTDTVLYADYRNVSRLDLALYRLPLATFMRLHGYGSYDYRSEFSPSPDDLVRTWSVPVSGARNTSWLERLDLVDAAGAQLPTGIYYLELTAPEVTARYPKAGPATYTFVRSHTNLVLKQTPTESLVWATDLASGVPLRGASVRFYRDGLSEEGAGTTDADGLWLAGGLDAVNLWDDYFAVLGEPGDAAFAVAYNNWDSGIQPWNFDLSADYSSSRYVGYLYTDRPIYRPGQTIYFKGIIRADDDAAYTIPSEIRTLDVTISDPQGKTLYEESLPLNELGTLNDQFVLGEEASLGTYFLQIQAEQWHFYASTSFTVAEYRAPEFQVDVAADREAYFNGDTIAVTVAATYYFGGPVADAHLTWNVLSAPYNFRYDCPTGTTCPRYSWTDYEWGQDYGVTYGSYGRLIAQGEGQTDAEGRATFRVPADIAEELTSRTFTLEANVTDINNQVVSQRTPVVVHKGAFYVGLAPESRVAQAGKPQDVGVLVVDHDSQPVAGQDVTVLLMTHRWYSVLQEAEDGNSYWTWTTKDTPVYTTTVRTGADGKANAVLTPEKTGSYRVRAIAEDSRGNDLRSSTYLWVWGGGEADWRRESTNRIDLIADRDLYAVGDVAEILIPSPYSGTVQALITIERGHILETQVRELTGSTEVLRIPIRDDFVPNVFVSVVLMQGSAQTPVRLASFKMGQVMLPVSTESKALHITLTPDRDMAAGGTYRPRETAIYDVQVTDSAGNPVQAELSLRLADLAVLALAGESEPTLLERFWSQRGLAVRTSLPLAVAMEAYNRELEPAAKGGGGGEGEDSAGLVRTRFADTAFWDATVRTDATGHARVEVPLPDNLTTWRMQARGITADTLVGRSEGDIRTTLDLLVRSTLPRFFVVGDEAQIATVVHNNTAEAVRAQVTLTVDGLRVDGETVRTVEVPAGGLTNVVWPVTVLPGDAVTVRAEARAGALFDGREDVLPVYAYAAPEVTATAGRLSGPEVRQEVVQLPAAFDPSQGELTVAVAGSLTAATQDSLDYLEQYPYECVEQTVSRFLPNVMTFEALTEVGNPRPDLEQALRRQVGVALQRLYNEQHYDGGWGWWVSDESDPYLTTYVLQGLLEAYRAGFAVDADTIHQAAAFLREHLTTVSVQMAHWQANRLAYQLYVLADYTTLVAGAEPSGELGRAVTLFTRRDRLDRYGQAMLAVALGLLDPQEDSRVRTLMSDLAGDAVASATGTHWEEATPDYWNMNTDIRTTAIVIWALAQHDPESQLLPDAVRWLMDMRQPAATGQSYWKSTHTTAWALMGLVAYMRATGELRGDFSYVVSLNGAPILDGTVAPQTIAASQQLTFAIGSLLADQANRLIIQRDPPAAGQSGEGQLYYTAQLRTFLPAGDVPPLDRGIVVARQYSRVDDPESLVSAAQVGDVLRVKVTVVAPTDLYYVMVEDPLPAGCEAVDVTLRTTSVVGEQPEVRNLSAEEENLSYRWYGWGWWWFSHSEIRDEKVSLFSTYLPRGTYEYTYLIRASVPGTYSVIPTTAYEMYYPDVMGRGEGGTFVIQGE